MGSSARSRFEPRRGRDPEGGLFARKPTATVAGHSGDHSPDLETLRANPSRLPHILIQGIEQVAILGFLAVCGGSFGLCCLEAMYGHARLRRCLARYVWTVLRLRW